MRIVYCLIFCLLIANRLSAQDVRKKFKAATEIFEKDSQMRHAIYSLYVIDGKTGQVVFDKNSEIGLAPASCQKLFTSGAAFEMLGNGFQFKTDIGYRGKMENGDIMGDLTITGGGDPTLGSWRFEDTKEEFVLRKIADKLKQLKVKRILNGISVSGWSSTQTIPDGWIWQDIGNYYGAGAGTLNWRENQYDLYLQSGSIIGSHAEVIGTNPSLLNVVWVSEATAAEKGSGDNAYIYLPPGTQKGVVRGTIPIEERKFTISGSIPDPSYLFVNAIRAELEKNKIYVSPPSSEASGFSYADKPEIIVSIYSPTLDSINYWFLRRSINLYGEALVKVIAHQKLGMGSTEKGVGLVQDFWSQHGIDKAAINIIDGSGLSPQNRVTTNALVKVLQYAKTRPWYNSFYLSLPTYNGIKMKSGSIGGARSFAGYHTRKDGHEYIFAIIVNNYDGSSGAIVKKMYQMLDVLK